MNITELSNILRDMGVVGAGGAGFPTYGKLSEKADTILMNCAECEPLLELHKQLLKQHPREILKAFHLIAETLSVKEAVIGIKEKYESTIQVTVMDFLPGRKKKLPQSMLGTSKSETRAYKQLRT